MSTAGQNEAIASISDAAQRIISAMHGESDSLRTEVEALRARIAELEQQPPRALLREAREIICQAGPIGGTVETAEGMQWALDARSVVARIDKALEDRQ